MTRESDGDRATTTRPTASRQYPGSNPDQLAYGIEDASRRLGLGRTTTFAEIAAGRLKTFRVGKRRLVADSSLREYVADRMAEAGQ